MKIAYRRLVLIFLPLLLVACGGGSVGGTVSGLADGDSVTLQNNGKDDLTVTKNGVFEFDDLVLEEGAYSVTVSKQPASASCAVSNGSGVIDVNGTNIEDVVVTCTPDATLVGNLTGLATGLSIEFTATSGGTSETIEVSKDGAFAFTDLGILDGGVSYSVTISRQPIAQSCTLTPASGNVTAGKQTSITVTCS